jgi:excisionase family DNA binding protein
MNARLEQRDDLVDVLTAARLVDRNPETVRRWIRSGRLTVARQGRQFLVALADVEAVAGRSGRAGTLQAWAELATAARHGAGRSALHQTAADLVISDRRGRDGGPGHARR